MKILSFRSLLCCRATEEEEEGAATEDGYHGNCRDENSCSVRPFISVIAASFLRTQARPLQGSSSSSSLSSSSYSSSSSSSTSSLSPQISVFLLFNEFSLPFSCFSCSESMLWSSALQEFWETPYENICLFARSSSSDQTNNEDI